MASTEEEELTVTPDNADARHGNVLNAFPESATGSSDAGTPVETVLQQEIKRIQTELDETRSLITVSKFTFQEQLETERRKCTEEVATLKRLFKETLNETFSQSRHQHENEVAKLKANILRLESELNRLKMEKDGPNVFSAVTKTLVRKVGNLANAGLASQFGEKAEQNLEASMKSAQEANDVLRSVVLPLEETIQELKEKLRAADKQLQVYETTQTELVRGTQGLLELVKQESCAGQLSALEQKVQSNEISPSASELEILVAHLASQKCILIDERDRLRSHLNDCMKLLDAERRSNRQLRESQTRSSEDSLVVASFDVRQEQSSAGAISSSTHVADKNVATEEASQSEACHRCQEQRTEMDQLRDEIARLQRQLKASQAESEQASHFVKEIEQKWTDVAKDYEKQVTALYSSLDQLGAQVQVSGAEFKKYRQRAEDDLRRLLYDREGVSKELTRLQEENEYLLGLHSASAEQLQNEVIDLPDSAQDMQYMLLKLREDLISAKVSKEASVRSLQNEILSLKDQLLRKEAVENSLSNEVDHVRQQLGILHSVHSQLEEETNRRKSVEQVLYRAQEQVRQAQDQLAKFAEYKAKCEAEIHSLRSRVSALQTDLETSETVQRDFVQLSQQLQVQLEKIRQSEKELRWQHEDDVDNCAECKQQFSVTKRKHRCRHCGQIFCAECLRKTVYSGPLKRPARVCNVCYYLLVPESAPFFSSETNTATL